MPVIVVGADTELGQAIVPALQPASGEIRLFASDESSVAAYRSTCKVAVGDISDGTHVGGAAIGAFCAVVIASAAHDDRERHFADTPTELLEQWADGLQDAGISRVVLVGEPTHIPEHRLDQIGAEFVYIDTSGQSATDVAALVSAAESAAESAA